MHSNLTHTSNYTELLPDSHYIFPALVFGILLIVVIICGNLLVCLSVWTEKALKTTTNYFIVSLAVADLLLAVLVLPLFVYSEVIPGRSVDLKHSALRCADDNGCDAVHCLNFQPLRNKCRPKWEEARKTKLKNSMHASMKFQSGHSLPQCPRPAIERDPADVKPKELNCYSHPDCTFPKEYKDGHTQTIALPKLNCVQAPSKKKRAKINGRERKAMKVLPVVVGVFLFCWTPFFVVHITRALCESCDISPELMSIVTWLGYVNSALNPIIYTVFNTEFRNFFRKFLRSCC
ncbi:UNVERIFIED_CONTAM: hypothetical protein FKN15_011436 [Acipenser sinensis]